MHDHPVPQSTGQCTAMCWSTFSSTASASLPAGECFTSPLLAPGLLLLGCRDDQLHCLMLEGGGRKV